ncbi:hypothetical protein CL634_10660 [bacterium]|nr:hypothetical protein [bacterium]|tara:strand:+ start:356 stop:703 length:348 start_codon:yes stop_codon:yes gene_type:complete
MEIESIKGWDKRANGTCLRGYITGDYNLLVETFGPPIGGNDEYKTDAEWLLVLNDKVVVTIYNYKTGRNYLGDSGQDVEDITDWHVGGKSSEGLLLLDEYFEDNKIRLQTTLDRF